jgi:hypothetical protein
MKEKAHRHLIRYALDKGCTFEVDDGGNEMPFKTSTYKETVEGVEAVDLSHLFILDKNDRQVGWALVVLDAGARPEESVADHNMSDFMEEWARQYSISGRASHG